MKYFNFCRKLIIFLFLFFISAPILFGSIVVLNGLTHENSVATGENYRGSIEIQNTSTASKSVKIYLRDYLFNYNGESRHDAPGTIARSNSGWINYNPELLTLSGGEKATIEFEVKVPEQDSLKGTYWSVIMVEGIVPPDTIRKRGVTINTAIRYAIQVVTHIGNSGTSDLQFLGLEMNKDSEENILNILIENTGERQLKPKLALELFDENGNTKGVFKTDSRKTFPGTSVRMMLDLETLEPGKYTGVLVADCSEDQVFGTNISIELE